MWEDIHYYRDDLSLCLHILKNFNSNDTRLIEELLIENEFTNPWEISMIAGEVTEIPSIYRIVLNCKSNEVRKALKSQLKYTKKCRDEDYEYKAQEWFGALFG